MSSDIETTPNTGEPKSSRRSFILGACGVAAAGIAGKLVYDRLKLPPQDVFIGRATDYSADIVSVVRLGLAELGIKRDDINGKTVLLKPNLVEPSASAPHINTHPKFVLAVAETFRKMDAKEVFIAEGQGHVRDTDYVLEQSGLGTALNETKLRFADLNHDSVVERTNGWGLTGMKTLFLPRTLVSADLIVSLPKMKTHHWAGVTCSMKNLFGVMPGICYGWPKNVLHQVGIPNSIVDINATVKPHLAIVDGIVGMEGDGPIMGEPKNSGVVVMGRNLPAVDATCCRLMSIDPHRVQYLEFASRKLGPISESLVNQRGETIASLTQKYGMLDLPQFNAMRL